MRDLWKHFPWKLHLVHGRVTSDLLLLTGFVLFSSCPIMSCGSELARPESLTSDCIVQKLSILLQWLTQKWCVWVCTCVCVCTLICPWAWGCWRMRHWLYSSITLCITLWEKVSLWTGTPWLTGPSGQQAPGTLQCWVSRCAPSLAFCMAPRHPKPGLHVCVASTELTVLSPQPQELFHKRKISTLALDIGQTGILPNLAYSYSMPGAL